MNLFSSSLRIYRALHYSLARYSAMFHKRIRSRGGRWVALRVATELVGRRALVGAPLAPYCCIWGGALALLRVDSSNFRGVSGLECTTDFRNGRMCSRPQQPERDVRKTSFLLGDWRLTFSTFCSSRFRLVKSCPNSVVNLSDGYVWCALFEECFGKVGNGPKPAAPNGK
jgi:hypothetical protein